MSVAVTHSLMASSTGSLSERRRQEGSGKSSQARWNVVTTRLADRYVLSSAPAPKFLTRVKLSAAESTLKSPSDETIVIKPRSPVYARMQKDHTTDVRQRSCSSYQRSVDYGSTKITQHALLKMSESS